MQHLWLTDCKSLEDHLLSDSLTKTDDKRLSVDIAALRQLIWQNADEEDQEELSAELPDQIRWIDTSKMLVDCLTKDMKTNYLRDTLKSGIYNIVPTAESEVTKLAKQKYRRMKSQSLEQAEEVEEDVENDWAPGIIINARFYGEIAKRSPTQFQSHGCEICLFDQSWIESHIVKLAD